MGDKQMLPFRIKVDLALIALKVWHYNPQKFRTEVVSLDAI